ncbi:uncharacterized protein LOC123539249 [Mercenaria mercenaria]|uniref:uncharacterized protein LOC123539249 n=1 Tax=Mercenaria mercenaria TaxID=6596 RepID=UPI001E1D99BA|nr:uncharacterized protein LOC123539249 [Mercenaria mercenaria]
MELDISKIFILFALVSSVSSVPNEGWREVPVNLKRAIGSASEAAADRGVRYISMLKAYEKIDNVPGLKEHYWVSFIAVSIEGESQECEGIVLWTGLRRIVKRASCKPCTTGKIR